MDGLWFNSGLLMLSSSLPSARELGRPAATDPLLGDQGYLNAMRYITHVSSPLFNVAPLLNQCVMSRVCGHPQE